MSDVTERVRDFIVRAARLRALEDDENILESGLVNSLLLAQILNFVEEQLDIEVSDDDLVVDNFRSVAAISALVERTRAMAGGVTPPGEPERV
ncbi:MULTISPECIES: acyl carrier protein [unclassified Streptomyces]|uniref:acyl carrier protein n=1 Tax=unclassified Streptomyces TaxID=2593676 RepID=UPI0038027F13